MIVTKERKTGVREALAISLAAAALLLAGPAAAFEVGVLAAGADSEWSRELSQTIGEALSARGYESTAIEIDDGEGIVFESTSELEALARSAGVDAVLVHHLEWSERMVVGTQVLTLRIVSADGSFDESIRKRTTRDRTRALALRLIDKTLLPGGTGVAVRRTPAMSAAVLLTAFGVQAVTYILPYAPLSTSERIGRHCPDCVHGALGAYLVGSPALSTAAAWKVAAGSRSWRPSFWWMLAGGYLGAIASYGLGWSDEWGETDEGMDFLALGLFPVLLPASGVFVAYLLTKRSAVSSAREGRVARQKPRVAWIPPLPLVSEGRFGISLGGLAF
ncbi:MAG: hypothetical protein R6V85_14720 [Polyangia bacterium]